MRLYATIGNKILFLVKLSRNVQKLLFNHFPCLTIENVLLYIIGTLKFLGLEASVPYRLVIFDRSANLINIIVSNLVFL